MSYFCDNHGCELREVYLCIFTMYLAWFDMSTSNNISASNLIKIKLHIYTQVLARQYTCKSILAGLRQDMQTHQPARYTRKRIKYRVAVLEKNKTIHDETNKYGKQKFSEIQS